MEEQLRFMRAQTLLLVHIAQTLSERGDGPAFRPEVTLADAGFNARDVAAMLGKSPTAGAKAISRARAARRGGEAVTAPDPSTAFSSGGDATDA